MWLKKSIALFFIILSISILAEEAPATNTPNDLEIERTPGTLVKMTGKYKFNFSVTKDWKTLHLIVTDLKDQPVLLDLKNIEVFIRPIERRSPFKLEMVRHSDKQEGVFETTHYKGDLNFIENFKGFRVNTYITIGDERIVCEYLFSREAAGK
jgi:hypothetical protein